MANLGASKGAHVSLGNTWAAAAIKMKHFWIAIAIAAFVVLAASVCQFLNRVDSGDVAPLFSLQNLAGETISLEQYRGRPILIHFWAKWCGVCRQELPFLERFARDAASEGFVVLSISEDGEENKEAVRTYLGETPLSMVVLFDRNGSVADTYQSFGVPESFLVDKSGMIVWRHDGPIDWNNSTVRAKIRALVGVVK